MLIQTGLNKFARFVGKTPKLRRRQAFHAFRLHNQLATASLLYLYIIYTSILCVNIIYSQISLVSYIMNYFLVLVFVLIHFDQKFVFHTLYFS